MDAKKSDHAYQKPRPKKGSFKHNHAESIARRSECNAHTLPAGGKMVERAEISAASDHAHRDHCYLNSSKQRRPSRLLRDKSTGKSSQRRKAQPAIKAKSVKMSRVNNRDSDHLYNTRRVERTGAPSPEKTLRHTDHLYNLRRGESSSEVTTVKRPNNRDTDHLYNIQTTRAHSFTERGEKVLVAEEGNSGDEERKGSWGVDKRVVDKDHMYQHNSRKTRGKQGRRGKRKSQTMEKATPVSLATKRKAAKRVSESSDSSTCAKRPKQTSGAHGPKAHHTSADSNADAGAVSVKSEPTEQTVIEESVAGGGVCSISLQGEMVADPLSEHGYTTVTVPCRGSIPGVEASSCSLSGVGVAAKSLTCSDTTLSQEHSDTMALQKHGSPSHLNTVVSQKHACQTHPDQVASQKGTNSPTHSDSDHVCEDDSRRSGVFHIDHMYVHTDYLDSQGTGHSEACLAGEGYRQEHSYAFSEGIRYDACKDCSQLVQQLIGTIHQQRKHIEDLKKQLEEAQARNTLLSTLFSNQAEQS